MKVLDCKNSEIVGVSSHFAKQDSSDLSFTKLQLERFLESVAFFEKTFSAASLRHIAASGATLQLPESHLDMVRPGVALYGAVGGEHLKGLLPLKPVMSLSSRVVYFKVVKKGNGVSYYYIWTADEDTRVATVSIGYGDGFRRLSNKGQVIIRGKKYPMIGTFCMDQMMVSLGAGGEAYNGDEVMLIGKQGEEEITVEEIAKILECDVREVFCTVKFEDP